MEIKSMHTAEQQNELILNKFTEQYPNPISLSSLLTFVKSTQSDTGIAENTLTSILDGFVSIGIIEKTENKDEFKLNRIEFMNRKALLFEELCFDAFAELPQVNRPFLIEDLLRIISKQPNVLNRMKANFANPLLNFNENALHGTANRVRSYLLKNNLIEGDGDKYILSKKGKEIKETGGMNAFKRISSLEKRQEKQDDRMIVLTTIIALGTCISAIYYLGESCRFIWEYLLDYAYLSYFIFGCLVGVSLILTLRNIRKPIQTIMSKYKRK